MKKINVSVKKKTPDGESVIKDGSVSSMPDRVGNKAIPNPKVIGMSKGVTLNMSNYESCRIDVWMSDELKDGETYDEAFDRISSILTDRIVSESESLR